MKVFKEEYQPCFGFSLPRALRIMAIANFLMILMGVGFVAYDVYERWDRWQYEKLNKITDYYIRLSIWNCYGVHVLCAIPLDVILFVNTKMKNTRKLKIFFVGTLINNTWACLVYYTHTFIFGIHMLTIAVYSGYIIYKYYECAVVFAFIKEIIEENEAASAFRKLKDEEVITFENGLEKPSKLQPQTLLEQVLYERFKKEEYEISVNDLRIDKTNPLGRGAYGICYRGQLSKVDGYQTPVAVKTVDPIQTDVSYFKALLTELKIMCYVGKHENIVNLLGVYTAEIRERKLYIVMELCVLGNLLDYLRGVRGVFTDFVRNGCLSSPRADYDRFDEDESEITTTKDLIKWSYQIACGMEYLELQKVIHGDLACRNVLIQRDRTAKITDFGLARQLYAYSVYVKKQNTPLPWRSLAIESLTDMQFSSASDVWTYGITLWEIFTLGETPWPGYEFTLAFVEQVKGGLRLKQPHYATNNIGQMMLKCWNGIPSQRPNFSEIVSFFLKEHKDLLISDQTPTKSVTAQLTATNEITPNNDLIQNKKETAV